MDIFNKKELELTIKTLSNTDEFDEDEIITVLEEVFSISARQKFSKESVIVTNINDDFEASLFKQYKVIGDNWEGMNTDEKYSSEYHIYDDQIEEKLELKSSDYTFGDLIDVPLKNFTSDRHVISVAKQQLKLKLIELKRNKIKESLLSQGNELIPVIVKGFDKKGYSVELQNGHFGKIPTDNLFNPSERLKVGSRQLVMLDLKAEHGLIFNRKGNNFIRKVLSREIEDISNEVIKVDEICKVDDFKTVIAVSSPDQHIDAVGSCIGSRGVRINAVSENLNGQNIEIIKWSNDIGELIASILNKDVKQVIINNQNVTIVVNDDDFDNILGRNNYKLTVLKSFLNSEVNIIKSTDYSKEEDHSIEYFSSALNLDDDSATLISNAGFNSIDELSRCKISELAQALDIDDESCNMLIQTSKDSITKRNLRINNLDTDLSIIKELDFFLIDKLINSGINNREDLADLDTFELQDIIPIEHKLAGEIIIDARRVWN